MRLTFTNPSRNYAFNGGVEVTQIKAISEEK
jgi:hypothetical protein